MLRITGYSDKYTAFPGEEIKFYVNAEKNENMFTQNRHLLQAEKCPKIAQTLHLKSENGPLRMYPLFLTTLDCFCGTLVKWLAQRGAACLQRGVWAWCCIFTVWVWAWCCIRSWE